ncbi:hypothetical protein J1605_014151 [Eschrichtius robustus]|uniref:Uncharacterized protein n=1 Tax=Eschrichtius robustus TaxID=9764 RepID=A0AB34GD15_ESCRO|nr:hypothetical protein J1605_014151 [Eschrichtius robustus]
MTVSVRCAGSPDSECEDLENRPEHTRKASRGRSLCRAAVRARAASLASLCRAQVLLDRARWSWWQRWEPEVVRDRFPWALPHGGRGAQGCSPGCSHFPLDGDEGGGRACSGGGGSCGLYGGVSGGDRGRIVEGKPRARRAGQRR